MSSGHFGLWFGYGLSGGVGGGGLTIGATWKGVPNGWIYRRYGERGDDGMGGWCVLYAHNFLEPRARQYNFFFFLIGK